jgi:hypothetical protein
MKAILGVEGEQYRETVQRALVDLGSEQSFARAALSFHEHYGWQVGRTTLSNRTMEAAQEAETSIDVRLQEATRAYGQAVAASPGVDTMLVELDGCDIRTGVSMTAAEAGVSDRDPRERVRMENWRDGRTGLARPLDAAQRLVVCRLDSYDEVCEQLFGVAWAQGLTPQSQVVAPGDGAKGLGRVPLGCGKFRSLKIR